SSGASSRCCPIGSGQPTTSSPRSGRSSPRRRRCNHSPRSEHEVSPRSLEVRPTYRRRRLWPWVAGAVVLLALGLWELRAHRRTATAERGSAETAPAVVSPAHPATVAGRVLAVDGRPA